MNNSLILPAEWHPQRAVMLTWPHALSDWGPRLAQVEATYLEIAHAVTEREDLLLVFDCEKTRVRIVQELQLRGAEADSVYSYIVPSNDTWARDHGPITVITASGRPAIMDFRFNGWGRKFESTKDDRITGTLHHAGCFSGTERRAIDLVLEGGAIESDGQGTLLALRRTIEDPARNPGLSLEQLEQLLSRELGVRRFLWLEHGQLAGDDTDGHVDTLVRFCNPTTLVYATATPDDPDYPSLRAMEDELHGLRTEAGEPYRLVPLPPVRPVFDEDGDRLPAGYANFLIINGAVLLPVYGQPSDEQARQVLQSCFPGREIVCINCRELIRQNGSLHCVTMQFPEELRLSRP